MPACLDAGLGLLPWSPLGGGWLTGKYRRDERPDRGTRLGEDPDRGVRGVRPPHASASAPGTSSTRCARSPRPRRVRWRRSPWPGWWTGPAVTSVILGARTIEQLTDNLGAAELQLTPRRPSCWTRRASRPPRLPLRRARPVPAQPPHPGRKILRPPGRMFRTSPSAALSRSSLAQAPPSSILAPNASTRCHQDVATPHRAG